MSWLATGIRVARATLTNQVARLAPALYVRLTGETGRGLGAESVGQAAEYFRRCFDDYFVQLRVASRDIADFLRGKRLLEYGPGDFPGVALLMIAHGAERVTCVDRFPLLAFSPKNLGVCRTLLDELAPAARARAMACFLEPDDPASGFRPERIEYRIDPDGLSHLCDEVDLVYSRAVLEHVNDLDATFRDMSRAMKHDALAIHQVDLKSHGLHRRNRLDFLTWSEFLWQLMYSHKGTPNRLRVDAYRRAVRQADLAITRLEPTLLADPLEVEEIKPLLARPFRELSDDDLSCLGFWLICHKEGP